VRVELFSQRPNVLGVDFGLEKRQFVIYGVHEGTAWVDIYFDDEWVGEIPATVTSQR